MFTRPQDIQDILECNGIRRTPSVPITQTKMQLLLGEFVKDALSEVHINTRRTSITLCQTRLMTQVSSLSLTPLRITALATMASYTLICSQTSLHDKSKLVTELTTNMSEHFYAHPDWKPNGSVIDRKIKVDLEAGYQSAELDRKSVV